MLKINLQMANEKDDTTDGIKSLNEEIKLKSDLKDPNEIIDQKKLTNDDIKLTKIANDKINIEIIEINKADIMAKENDLTEKENKLSPNVKSDIKEKDNKESYSVVKMIKIDGEDQQEGVLTEEQKIGENKTVSHNNVDCKEIERNEEEQKENNNKDKILINSEGQKIEQDKSSITETKVKKDGIHDCSDLSQNENQQQIKTEDLKNSANCEKEVENFDSIKVTGKLNNDIEEKDNANEISDQKLVKDEDNHNDQQIVLENINKDEPENIDQNIALQNNSDGKYDSKTTEDKIDIGSLASNNTKGNHASNNDSLNKKYDNNEIENNATQESIPSSESPHNDQVNNGENSESLKSKEEKDFNKTTTDGLLPVNVSKDNKSVLNSSPINDPPIKNIGENKQKDADVQKNPQPEIKSGGEVVENINDHAAINDSDVENNQQKEGEETKFDNDINKSGVSMEADSNSFKLSEAPNVEQNASCDILKVEVTVKIETNINIVCSNKDSLATDANDSFKIQDSHTYNDHNFKEEVKCQYNKQENEVNSFDRAQPQAVSSGEKPDENKKPDGQNNFDSNEKQKHIEIQKEDNEESELPKSGDKPSEIEGSKINEHEAKNKDSNNKLDFKEDASDQTSKSKDNQNDKVNSIDEKSSSQGLADREAEKNVSSEINSFTQEQKINENLSDQSSERNEKQKEEEESKENKEQAAIIDNYVSDLNQSKSSEELNDPITESKVEPYDNLTNEATKMLFLGIVSEIIDKIESENEEIKKRQQEILFKKIEEINSKEVFDKIFLELVEEGAQEIINSITPEQTKEVESVVSEKSS